MPNDRELWQSALEAANRLLQLLNTIDQQQGGSDTTKKPKKATLERFNDFWELYPRKVAKVAAQKAWIKNNCDQIADSIIEGMPGHSSFCTSDISFIPYPATWLNQRRWEDAKVVNQVEAVDLNKMIENIEQRHMRALEEQDAYLRESGFLPSNGSAKGSISNNGTKIQ